MPARPLYYSLIENIRGDNIVSIGRQMRRDLDIFAERLEREQPALVIGLGQTSTESRFETVARNLFHGRKISADAPERYSLFIPNTSFPAAIEPTSSFCNWSAFRLANIIAARNLPVKLAFLHLTPQDISQFSAS